MILPLPTRVPLFYAVVCTSLLVLVQLLEGTDPRYSALTFAFFMLSTFAFNIAKGLSRPSGAYIFFFSVLVVDVGTVYKALLGQPAQTGLQQPLLTMGAYVGTMAAMLLAAFATRKIATSEDGMAALLNVRRINFTESSLGCLLIYALLTGAQQVLPGGGGQVLHAIAIINPFLPLGLLLATIAAVRNSGGVRSTNAISLVALGYSQYAGLLSFSKQGMFTPFVCWLLGCAWARFRLRLVHFVVIGVFAVLAQKVFFPLSSLRNDVVTGTQDERHALIEHYMTHPAEFQRRTHEWEPPSDFEWRTLYYGQPQGLWDRLTMMPNDSMLISFSDQGHYFGYRAMQFYFENWVPHVIDRHKLEGISVGGNAYSHEMGGLAEADTTTGISFSPTAEAFHIDGWRGVLLLQPAIFLLLFVTVDAVCGDVRRQPWGLFPLLAFSHLAPEALLGGAVTATWYGNLSILLAIFVCGYITPVLGMLLSGNKTSRDAPARPMMVRRLPSGALQPS